MRRRADPPLCSVVHVVSRSLDDEDLGGVLTRSRPRTGDDPQSTAATAAGDLARAAVDAPGRDAPDRRQSPGSRTDVRTIAPGVGATAGEGADSGCGRSRVQRLMVGAIAAYQRAYEGRPSPCRFFPSCSEYSREAIETHGSGRGLWLTVRRMARCRPFGPSGFDPVPPPRTQQGCCATTPGLES